jgi:iron complex outermembrane receptor protein
MAEKKHSGSSFLLLILLLLLASVADTFAQTRRPGIRGTVTDEGGGVLAGALVTATNRRTGAVASVASDARGAYGFPELPAGDYAVQAVLPGFRGESLNVTIVQGEIPTLDIRLAVAPFMETVTVTRADQALSTVPQAVSLIAEDEIHVAQRQVSLNESLRAIPGVFVQDRVNLSESFGVRLSIRAPVRGVGIGVRGVQILQDDIPLTMADGTTQPTNVDLGSTGQIEVIRGPSSVLYGNSAGGVITLRTELPSSRPFHVQPNVQFGSDGYQRLQLKTSGTRGRVGYLLNVSRMKTDGFRQHSSAEVRQANMVVRAALSPRTDLRGVFNLFDMPFAESPGTLALTDARNNPRSVRQLAINQGLGESSTQGQGGVTLEHRFDGGQVLRTTGWGMWRDVWNPIPFRLIEVGRTGSGVRLEFAVTRTVGSVPVVWTTGFDASSQRDDSVEHENAGTAGRAVAGALLVDQREHVRSLGPFAQVSITPRPRWTVTAGIRYDSYNFNAADRLLADGDQSGGRTMDAFSPSVGLTYAARPDLNIYGSFATAYETPTLHELSNRPSGEGGFNLDLEPEDLRTFEAGVRGLIKRWRMNYDVAVYSSTLQNALVQYQRADEVEYFRNAGESSRNGIEALVEWKPDARVSTRLAYTYQRFMFERFVTDGGDFSGKREPGAPPHQLLAGVTCRTAFGLTSIAQLRWVDAYPVNDANTFSNWASKVLDLRFALDRRWRTLDVRPFLGIDNLFNERFNGSTVPNAFGNRFFEPAPGRQIYVGLALGAQPR